MLLQYIFKDEYWMNVFAVYDNQMYILFYIITIQ